MRDETLVKMTIQGVSGLRSKDLRRAKRQSADIDANSGDLLGEGMSGSVYRFTQLFHRYPGDLVRAGAFSQLCKWTTQCMNEMMRY
jgi:hypothetical protein